MRRRDLLSLLAGSIAATTLSIPTSAHADELVIKLGTRAPQSSPWFLQLKEAANLIRDLSGGQIQLRLFGGGAMGDEGEMLQKLRIGQLQATAVSTIGLQAVSPAPQAIDMPMLVKNVAERDYLLAKLAPRLEALLAERGLVVLSWSDIGFTYFFSTKPRPTLAEMRQTKLFCWSGDPAAKDAWLAGQFKPVVLSSTDMVPGLTTGMIDALVYTPTLMLALRAYEKAIYMLDLPYTSLTGLTVIDKKVWDKIPADLQVKIRKIFSDLAVKSTAEARKKDAEALDTMKAKGLKVIAPTDPQEWPKAVESVYGAIRGKVVPADLFDTVHATIKQYRATGGK
jgi:TRAP-type C4-dicarboxylate transport system substrate-binding protein